MRYGEIEADSTKHMWRWTRILLELESVQKNGKEIQNIVREDVLRAR